MIGWRKVVLDAVLGSFVLFSVATLISISSGMSGLQVAGQRDAEDIRRLRDGQTELVKAVNVLAVQQVQVATQTTAIDEKVDGLVSDVKELRTELKTEVRRLDEKLDTTARQLNEKLDANNKELNDKLDRLLERVPAPRSAR